MKTKLILIASVFAIIGLASLRFQHITVFWHDGTTADIKRVRMPLQDDTYYPPQPFAYYDGIEYICFGLVKSQELYRRPILMMKEQP